MKNKLGFTLLELLVVVLIIGILAAIALPQYKKAVEKSKATQALTLLQALYQSATVYQLNTGNWPTSIEELDIDIPADFKGGGEWKVWFEGDTDTKTLGAGITRLQGKYAGTGFCKYKEHPYNVIPKETNLCLEHKKGNAPIFNGAQGSYCEEIFEGKRKYVGTNNQTDIWALP